MDVLKPAARVGERFLPLAAILACALFSVDASAQQLNDLLPPGATAGGAQPFLGRRSLATLVQQDSLQIPPLVQRPLGLNEGPHVRVSKFQLLGAVARPAIGISLTEISDLLNKHLAAQPADGYSINGLQAVADDITAYYRSKGLILAQAFVPAQDVKGGVVNLQVVEGNLGGVDVEGNKVYSQQAILAPFDKLLNRPVDRDTIEQALLTLQDYPGLTVFGTFRQGQSLGDTELHVSVRKEDRFSVTPSFDNYGSEFTGTNRAMLQFQVNNPAGNNDRLSGYIVKTANPSNGTFGGLTYEMTRLDGKWTYGLGASKNRFDVTDVRTGRDLNIAGTVNQLDLYGSQRFANRRTFRADGTVDLASKSALIRESGPNPHDHLRTLSYTFNYYAVGPRQRGINLGYARLTRGRNDGPLPSRVGSSQEVSTSYGKLELSFQHLQKLGDHESLLLRVDGQQSSDLLVSLEQYSIGGPANVRAYPVAEALVDAGGSASLEWIVDAPGFAKRVVGNRTWGDIFQLSVFYDYGGGRLNDPLNGVSRRVDLRGYGMGLQFAVSQKFRVRVDAATPEGDRVPSNGKDPQYYMSASYTF